MWRLDYQIKYHQSSRTQIRQRSGSLFAAAKHFGERYHQKQRVVLLDSHKALVLIDQKRRHECQECNIEDVFCIFSMLFIDGVGCQDQNTHQNENGCVGFSSADVILDHTFSKAHPIGYCAVKRLTKNSYRGNNNQCNYYVRYGYRDVCDKIERYKYQ